MATGAKVDPLDEDQLVVLRGKDKPTPRTAQKITREMGLAAPP
jgi:hypothetical protein